MRFVHRANHPITPLVIVALLYFCFLSVRLDTHNAAFFVQAGEYFVDTTEAPANLFTVTSSTGYDGTFYYRLALTPLTREHTAFGITLDTAPYRHQRILYPLFGWFLSFGSPPFVIYSLILVNYLALGALGWLGGLYVQSLGRHALWGVVFPLYPGFLFTLSRNLTEIVAAVFVLATLVALQRDRPVVATGTLVLAILSKETALLVAGAMTVLWIVQVYRRRTTTLRWYVWVIPGLVYGLWQLWLQFWWNMSHIEPTQANLGLPFRGILRGFQNASSVVGGSHGRWVIEVSALAALTLIVLFVLRDSEAREYEKLNWGFYLALLIVLTAQVWIEDWAFLRAASLYYVFSAAILVSTRSVLAMSTLVAGAGAWSVLALDLLYFR